MIRILLVDDQKMIREALKAWLEPETDIEIIGTADNGISAVEQVEQLHPDVVLMNIEMPGLDGASATQFITNKFSGTKVVILSSEDRDEYIAKSLSVGAKGYLLKNTDSQDIAAAIRSVYRGYTQIGPGLLEKILIQTDSGLILSKLNNPDNLPITLSDDSSSRTEKQFMAKSKKAILSLQSSSRQHSAELRELHDDIEQIQPEIAKISQNVGKYSPYIWLTRIFLFSLPFIFLTLFNLHTRARNLEQNIIPLERIGLYGEYNISGLAQRVASTFKKDFVLSNVSTVHVAQNGSTIVLKGEITDSSILHRMRSLAKDVKGVTGVDTRQIDVLSSKVESRNSKEQKLPTS